MTEPSTVRLVVVGLIVIAVAAIAGAIFLEATDHDAGQSWTIATASLTGLAAVLVNTRTGADPVVHQAIAAAEDAGAAKNQAQGLEALIATEAAAPPRRTRRPAAPKD